MTDYIETKTKDGLGLLIEVAEDGKGAAGFGRQSDSGDISNQAATEAYNQMLAAIQACANGLIDTLQGLDAQPNSAAIEFGIKVDAKAGAMIAKTLGEGQFKVSLSWKQPEPETDKD